MNTLYRFTRIANVRCPWCGQVGAELWAAGDEVREVRSNAERAALGDGPAAPDPADNLKDAIADAFSPYGTADHPWCTDPTHRWVLPERLRRRALESDTPINLRAKRP